MMPCYNYSEEQISWYLHRVDPRPGVLIFIRKSVLSIKQVDLGDMFKNVYKTLSISTIVVSPNTLSATPPTSSAMKTPENTEEYPDDPETADQGDV
jgi:hypothetical protein